MTTYAKIELKGLDEYFKTIKQAGIDIDAAAQRALDAGGEILHSEMDNLVPKDEGNLQAHIVILGPFLDGNLNYVEVGVLNADAKTTIYGNVQEYGSPSKNIKSQSYIRAAVDRKKSAVRKAIRESLKSEGFVD